MKRAVSILFVTLLLLTASLPIRAEDVPMLKDVYADYFRIGFAANSTFWLDEHLLGHFNSVTSENNMKWEALQPRPGVFRFVGADALVDYAERNGIEVIGHTLVWHSQTPDWVFEDEKGNPLSREELLERMENHIKTVVGRYKGRIKGWDVVNEAIEYNSETGKWELRDSKWRQIIGDDFIEYAFRFAHEADPDAELYYNDYNSTDPGKRDAIYNLVKGLLDKGLRVDGIGMQGHWEIDSPSETRIREAIEKYSSLGVKVHITELDLSVYSWNDRANRYADGLPEEVAARQAERYSTIFRIFKEYAPVIERVTFWGVRDSNSWKNNFPVPGRKDYPLLFDKDGQPKPAFWAVLDPARPWQEVRDEYGYGPTGPRWRNAALNRPVSANAAEDRADRAVDGLDNTSWQPDGEPPFYLTVDLGESITVERWVVKNTGAGIRGKALPGDELFNARAYKLQVSPDGQSWTDVDEVKDNTANVTDRMIKPVEAQHVRLVILEPTSIPGNNRTSIVEFAVYTKE